MAKKLSTNFVVGYSLDSAILARDFANRGEHVTYLKTGPLGYPLDDIGDYISSTDVTKVQNLLGMPGYGFIPLINSRFAHIPYDDLKFTNSKNGLISYPINRLTFETAEESDEIAECANGISMLKKRLDESGNYVSIYKTFFPKWLYDSLLRHMGIAKWGGIRQSKFTRKALAREFDLTMLGENGTGVVFKPQKGYQSLCLDLLTHANIQVKELPVEHLKAFVMERQRNCGVYIMDNRIDVATGYHFGMFDRVRISTEITSEQGMEEFIDVSNGIVVTPTKEYWCASNSYGVITKLRSELFDVPNDFTLTELCPTIQNSKMVQEYDKLMGLYSGKRFISNKYVTTTII